MTTGANIAQIDRTARAVAIQVGAMACASYEVGVLDAAHGKMLLRTWTGTELAHGLPWLRRMNALGRDIYVRPSGSVGLVLVDDLDRPAILQLKGDGLLRRSWRRALEITRRGCACHRSPSSTSRRR